MKNRLKQRQSGAANPRNKIHTSILELIRVLNQLTRDDNLVIAAARHLLSSCRVTASRSLRPVKITAIQGADFRRKAAGYRARERGSGCASV
ncbi:MAG: hypothetical protein ACREQW_02560 [Candidatus Binatia bacterium]